MQQPDPAHVQQMVAMMLPMMVIFGVVISALIVIPFWMIFKKAGLGAPLSLLMLIPGVSVIMLYVLAFSRWKVMPIPEYGYPPTYPPPGYVPPAYPPAPAAAYVPPAENTPQL
jgi:hypothetical protein